VITSLTPGQQGPRPALNGTRNQWCRNRW